MRSAAELKAATMAAWVASALLGRGAAGVLQRGVVLPRAAAACLPVSASSSATISAAITVSRASPISPNWPRKRDDALVEVLGEPAQMVLLAVLAGHAELAAVDGDVDLRHRHPLNRWLRARADVSIAASSRRATSRLAASRLRARPSCAVEIGGEPGAVGVERVHLLGQRRVGCGRFRGGGRPRRRARPAPGSGAWWLLDDGRIAHRLNLPPTIGST